LNSKISASLEKLRPLYYGVAFSRLNNKIDQVVCSAPNYNLYEISTSNNYGGSLNGLISQQVCTTTALEDTSVARPYAAFASFDAGLEFFNLQTQAFSSNNRKFEKCEYRNY
jgi:hypothetical protein